MTNRHCWIDAFILSLAMTSALIDSTTAGSRYIAIPIDGVDVIELNPVPNAPMPRLPRQADTYVSTLHPNNHNHPHHHHQHDEEPAAVVEQAAAAALTRHVLDYVDFGAHTGPNGAFSWYADYPSHR